MAMKLFPMKFYLHRARIFGILLVVVLLILMTRALWEFISS